MSMLPKHATRLYFDADIWAWLQTEAVRLRCSVSEVVRRLALVEMAKAARKAAK